MRKRGSINCIILVMLFSLSLLMSACGKKQIVITTGFGEGEVFRVEDFKCTESEVMLYLYNLHSQYERTYGSGIWTAGGAGTDLSENLKQTVLARLAKIKLMNIMAGRYQVVLNGEQKAKAEQAAKMYYASLSPEEIAVLKGISCETVEQMYEEYAVAELLYDTLSAGVNMEISDDEARVVRLHQIVLLRHKTMDDGSVSNNDTEELMRRAGSIIKRIEDGEDFDAIAYAVSDTSVVSVEMAKGIEASEVENMCFNLAEGEVGTPVVTEDGVYIYKCISTYDRQQTEERKRELSKERKKQRFDEKYEEFASGMEIYLNEDLWDTLEAEDIPAVSQTDFFEIYNRFFVSTQQN
ncbi:MAG: peptidylprolyl isomerase [Lachnospiraceae bacterium]|nr:peptidylprolyl isomerase [Lachnospiraceae bacterium]